MKKFVLFISIISLLGSTLTAAAQCTLSVGKGVPADDWNAEFTQNGPGTGLEPADGPGWTGADSTISIELPNGNTAFFFSDSFIGESPAKPGDGRVSVDNNGLRMREPNCLPPICGPKPEHIHYVFNSIVVRSKDGKMLRTIVGPPDKDGYSTSYFKTKDPKNTFWMGDPILVNVDGKKKIWIFLNEWSVARPFDKAFWIDYRGQSIAQLDAETLAIDKIEPISGPVDQGVWEISMWMDTSGGKKELYIWGMKNEGELKNVRGSAFDVVNRYKKLYVAKVDASGGLSDVVNANNWQAWNGTAWKKDLTKRRSIIPDADGISDELTIRRLNIGGKPIFVMVSFNTAAGYADWKDLYLYSACDPQGPFDNKYLFYTTPTAGQTKLKGMTGTQRLQSGLSVYNPHFHPQFTKDGKLLVSYNSNLPFGAKPGDSIYADFYKPRFVWVPIKGLE